MHDTVEGEVPMRVGELSSRSGVPVATIKFYVREGLLPAGVRTGPNQAGYDEAHLRRLRLVRALVDIGGLTIAACREVLVEIDAPEQSTHGLLGAVHHAVVARSPHCDATVRAVAEKEVDDLIRRRGWRLRPGNPARESAVDILATRYELGQDDAGELLDEYARAVETIAAAELDLTVDRSSEGTDVLLERTAVGIVLGGALITALRGLAQEDASARRFATD